jgi:hypothetical protein
MTRMCKKCGNEFGATAEVEGKKISLNGRSYCLECSPYGDNKGYELRRGYTKEKLEAVVLDSFSVAEVSKKLGLLVSGGTALNLRKLFNKFSIDISHFKGQGASFGDRQKGGPKKRIWEEVLVKRSSPRRESAIALRRSMIDVGIPYKCAICGLDPRWNDMELRLHVDHIDGDWTDCRLENVRFVCPNCHTQLPTYGMNKGLTDLTSNYRACREYRKKRKAEFLLQGFVPKPRLGDHKCLDCDKKINHKATRCKSCAAKCGQPTRIDWPDTVIILEMVQQTSWRAVAKTLGVSDNAVRKRVKNHTELNKGQVLER